jgi:hypothetical protein
MLYKIIVKLKQNKYAVFCVYKFIALLQRLAWLFNPILSIRRFWNVLSLTDKVVDFCFTSGISTEFVEKIEQCKIPSHKFASVELTIANYLYGHAKAFKGYVGLPDAYPIKVFYSHGLIINNLLLTHYNFSYDTRIPTFLAWGRNEEKMMSECLPNIKVYVVGTPFIYADNFFSEEYIQREKKRLGKNILVFPAHSAKIVLADFSHQNFIKSIHRYKKQFDTIRICLYWKDIQLDRHKIYMKEGFEVVTAGHNIDCNFVSRLKGLLSICDATISNGFGSHIGYSIAMNKPIKLLEISDYKDIGTPYGFPEQIKNFKLSFTPEMELIIDKLQQNENFDITQEMRDLIEPYWGLQEKKTKEELRQIFYESEQLFQKSPLKHMFLKLR